MIYLLMSTILAVLTAFFGLLLAGASLLRFIDSESFLALVGTLLLMTSFPLLVFSAHCLDRIDDVDRAYRQMVFGDPGCELEK